jgi:hypothetical protein
LAATAAAASLTLRMRVSLKALLQPLPWKTSYSAAVYSSGCSSQASQHMQQR